MPKTVCDFCLSEGKGLFKKLYRLKDGHHICKDCRDIILSYDLPLEYDLFQQLVTAQPTLRNMIMDAYLESHDPNETIQKFFPNNGQVLHEGEHCLNAVPTVIKVRRDQIPAEAAVTSIMDIRRADIKNVPDAPELAPGVTEVKGTLVESEIALYFLSPHFINCHRVGFIKRNTGETKKIEVVTRKNSFTYYVDHADLFFLRERFYRKARAATSEKKQHLIYIRSDNELTITPGIYEIPRSLKPGIYKVRAIKDDGLHISDAVGHVKDYYENGETINLPEGGVLESTGEYELEWVGESKDETKK
jgi:hypothetical protein